jgi:propionyl-CoA carboxylase alpha chain
MTMMKKVLIANRGEIAVRVMRTCERLGISTVAVYSEPDARSLHVKVADEAFALGGTTAVESYLDVNKVLEAANSTGCDALHPGYGFLSENAEFARKAEAAGLTFIGPPPDAITVMGDKMASKKLAAEAGVPIIPGKKTPISDADTARNEAAAIGYPILLKPAAGGGGKGMRIVNAPDEMDEALSACRAEAGKAFGDDRIFVERFIAQPRHIEIQILADAHGNTIYLGERECSIQRRYQKVIEEAPSPVVDPDLRARMGRSACDLAQSAGYVNAGTVEYILDTDGSFYFLEMNTRLQVEHPVTEFVTGLDLVEQQLLIASGEPLSLSQADVRIDGWAMEARICAEDPNRGFIPSTGMITRYRQPRGRDIRVDSGVEAGSSVGVFYDSMLAKLIAYGSDREQARTRLVDALNGFHIEGLSTNVDFANSVLNHPAFVAGDISTNFIAEHMDDPSRLPKPPVEWLHRMVIAALLVHHNRRNLLVESLKPMASTVGGVRATDGFHDYVVKADDDVFQVRLSKRSAEHDWEVRVDDAAYEITTPPFEFYRRRLRLVIGGDKHRFRLRYHEDFIDTAYCGLRRTFEVYSPREWALYEFMPAATDEADARFVVCPMPGLVVDVRVGEGEAAHAGQVLLTLESMKMESGVSAPRDGKIAKIHVEKGQTVDAGDLLVEFAD